MGSTPASLTSKIRLSLKERDAHPSPILVVSAPKLQNSVISNVLKRPPHYNASPIKSSARTWLALSGTDRVCPAWLGVRFLSRGVLFKLPSR